MVVRVILLVVSGGNATSTGTGYKYFAFYEWKGAVQGGDGELEMAVVPEVVRTSTGGGGTGIQVVSSLPLLVYHWLPNNKCSTWTSSGEHGSLVVVRRSTSSNLREMVVTIST